MPRHRRDRLRRRAAGAPPAGRRARRALPGPQGRAAARRAVGRARPRSSRATCADRRRCRPRSPASTSPTTWCTRSARPRLRGGRPARRRPTSPRRPARPAYAGSSTWAGRSRRPTREVPSPHLRSRAEVGRILLASGVPTAVLRAAVIIGSGSASFEMLRYLTERLPAMVTPRWVRNRIQPIAIRDVLRYLVGCADAAAGGQPGLRHRRAGRAHLRRHDAALRAGGRAAPRGSSLPVRPLTPSLSSHWVGLVTPVPNAHRPAAGGEPDPRGGRARARHRPVRARPARRADRLRPGGRAGAGQGPRRRGGDPLVERERPGRARPSRCPATRTWSGGTAYTDVRERTVDAPPAALWRVDRGRRRRARLVLVPAGLVGARLAGPAGRRRRAAPGPARPAPAPGRRGAGLLAGRGDRPGRAAAAARRDAAARPGLAGDARRAGRATGAAATQQRAVFLPRGLAGHAYWGSVAPFHAVVFGGMARNIARSARRARRR